MRSDEELKSIAEGFIYGEHDDYEALMVFENAGEFDPELTEDECHRLLDLMHKANLKVWWSE